MPSKRRAARLIRRPASGTGLPLPGSPPRFASWLAWAAPVLLAVWLVPLANAGPIQLVSADDRGVTLRLGVERYDLGPAGADGRRQILIPRLDLLDVPGRPKLPFATAVIALPPGANATATVTGEGAEEVVDDVRITIGDRPVVRADPDGLDYVPAREPVPPILDGAWPVSAAMVGRPFTLRRQRVAVVQLQPFRYDAASGRLWVRRTLTVRVSFGGARSAPSSLGAPAEDRLGEPVLRTTLLNYEQGRRWREPRPALGRGLFERPRGARVAPSAGQAAAAFDETEPEVRVRIAETGAWALDAAELLGKGYPAGVPIAEVSVHRHEFVPDILAPNPPYVTFEVPSEVDDLDGDGFFTAGDRIVLYAQSWWERSALAYETPYSQAQRNWGEADYVYATRVRSPRQGLRILPRSGWLGLPGLTPLASYPYRQRWQQNASYISAPRDTTQDPFLWITNPLFVTPAELPFETYDLDPSQPAYVGAVWVGLLATYEHAIWLAVRKGAAQVTTIADSVYSFGKDRVSGSGMIPGSALGEGATNDFLIRGKSANAFGTFGPRANIGLEYFEATYWRRYSAIQGYLSCNSGNASIDYEIFATGFSDPAALRVYDVTDSTAVRRLTDVRTEAVGGGFGVRFQDVPAGVQRRYVVFDTPKVPAPDDYGLVDRAALTNLYDRTGGDYLLVVPQAFAGTIGRLVALRQSQGLNVVVAPLEELNDAFNGGRKSPHAIKRFIRYAYDNWDTRFVLLFGDGSEDPQQVSSFSSIDWVPAMRFLGPVLAGGDEESFYEATVSDPWYVWCVDCADPSIFDPKVPDLAIGRLPVHNAVEADSIVSKLVRYENVTPDQTWRRKMVLVSDDVYSGATTFGGGPGPTTYCRRYGEGVFQEINERCRSIVLDEAGLGLSDPEVFNLSYYVPNYRTELLPCNPDPIPPDTCRCNFLTYITRARADAKPALFTRLAEGRLWWNYQGHANERVLSHEAFYSNEYSTYPDDKGDLQNYGKPFLFTAFSCHPNAFGRYQENSPNRRGPAIGEDLVDLAGRGAIASWASSGFELLPSDGSRHINLTFARALFVDPPRIPQPFDPVGGARVALGDVIAKAEVDYLDANQDNRPHVSPDEWQVGISYNLLGDPATLVTIGSPQAVFLANRSPVTDGVPVRLFTIGDTLRIEGDLVSNARIDTAWVERIEGTTTTAASVTDSLTPAFHDTTDASAGGRRYHMVYRTRLTAGTYTYRFRTIDRYGTRGQFDVVFRFETQLSAQGGPVRDGDVVGPNTALSLLLLSPSPLNPPPATDMTLSLNGQPLSFTAVPANNDQSQREWVLTWNYGPYSDGNYRLDLDVLGNRAASHTFQVKSQLQIQNPLAFPNPFNDERGTVFSFYLETDRSARVLLRVYTISGRLIYERTSSVPAAGYQQIPWNGQDTEGASLANGVYFYRLVAENGASTAKYEGRLVKLTKPHHVEEAP